MFGVRRGGDPEQPPADIIAKGQNPAFKEVVIDDPVERDRLCRAAGVDANDAWNAHRIVACVDLNNKVTYLPPNVSMAVLRHERGHEWYLQHDRTGRGFYPPTASFNWAQAFARPTETAATTPRGLIGGGYTSGQ